MKFLLKIVQGPNAGAEIALVEGVRVTLGSADSCDIVLADPTLPAEACAIEASADSVALSVSGSEPETLVPLQVRSFGSTALAVGPADAPWGPLTWEAPAGGDAAAAGTDEARSSSAPEAQEEAPLREGGGGEAAGGSTPSGADPAPSRPRRGRRLVCLVLLLLLLFFLVLLGLRWGWHRFLDKAAPEMLNMAFETERTEGLLPSIAGRYNLTLVETNGTMLARGDFATRAERLAATAELYEAEPGIALDLADAETLRTSTADLLAAATDGAITVADITNRVAVLVGRALDPSFLRATLEALRTDVPRLAGADTAAVVLDSPLSASAAPNAVAAPGLARAQRPRLPLCSILLQPYPCLVLQDGQRLLEGAEVGGYKIAKIAFDRIVFRSEAGEELEWTP